MLRLQAAHTSLLCMVSSCLVAVSVLSSMTPAIVLFLFLCFVRQRCAWLHAADLSIGWSNRFLSREFWDYLRDTPGVAAWFTADEVVLTALTPAGMDRSQSSSGAVLAAGGAAGLTYWLICFPADTVKSFMVSPSDSLRAWYEPCVLFCCTCSRFALSCFCFSPSCFSAFYAFAVLYASFLPFFFSSANWIAIHFTSCCWCRRFEEQRFFSADSQTDFGEQGIARSLSRLQHHSAASNSLQWNCLLDLLCLHEDTQQTILIWQQWTVILMMHHHPFDFGVRLCSAQVAEKMKCYKANHMINTAQGDKLQTQK